MRYVSYVKVAEYQRRDLVHLHAVIRLDRPMPAYRATELHPPPAPYGYDLLEHAIRMTVAEVAVPLPAELGAGTVHWARSSASAASTAMRGARSPAT